MKNPNIRISQLLAVATLLALGCGLHAANAATPAKKPADSPMVAKCKADLAKRLKKPARDIDLAEMKTTIWPNSALGMPKLGEINTMLTVPGSRIILEAGGSRYLYTTSTKSFRYGGPVSIWSYSVLFTKPVPNEPDLNADLYQCSLLGTNPTRIASAVTDYYPQDKGMVIIKRRTSRSSHDLLAVKADGSAKEKPLHSAMDFGAAAFNGAQDKWAGFVRPALGSAWVVAIGPAAKDTKLQTLPLPEGFQPGQIAWSGENVMILFKKDEQMLCAEISPTSAKPEWNKIAAHNFPGLPDYMLNKSESLEINQTRVDGQPSVEVVRVWFTGDRNVVANVVGFTMRGQDLLAPYAVIWGEKGSEASVCAVHIGTGEIIPCFTGVSRDIKPFLFPPSRSPLSSL